MRHPDVKRYRHIGITQVGIDVRNVSTTRYLAPRNAQPVEESRTCTYVESRARTRVTSARLVAKGVLQR